MKEEFIAVMAALGAAAGAFLGGWNGAVMPLIFFMGADYLTGLIVAGVFKNSSKSVSGTLNSRAGFMGICKKGVMMVVVMAGYQLDLLMGTTFIKEGVIMAFIGNELISITENAGLMGVPMPKAIEKAVEVLKKGE